MGVAGPGQVEWHEMNKGKKLFNWDFYIIT